MSASVTTVVAFPIVFVAGAPVIPPVVSPVAVVSGFPMPVAVTVTITVVASLTVVVTWRTVSAICLEEGKKESEVSVWMKELSVSRRSPAERAGGHRKC